MDKIIQKLKSLKIEVSIADNGGIMTGLYWRLSSLLSKEFGENSVYIKRLKEIKDIDYETQKERNKGKLTGIIDQVLDDIDDTITDDSKILAGKEKITNSKPFVNVKNNKVFVVHGHNEVMKQGVARVIQKLGLEPIILHEQPNQGLTIIEKFFANSNVGYAVVLLSADDFGYPRNSTNPCPKLRARQNVIFELGFFMAKLKRNRVFALVENSDDFEIPSDYHGVIYVPFDGIDGSWKYRLAKELIDNGFVIDLEKIV